MRCARGDRLILSVQAVPCEVVLVGWAGVVGFGTDFGTTASFSDAGTDELFSIIQKGESAAGRRSMLMPRLKSSHKTSACCLFGRCNLPKKAVRAKKGKY